MPYWRGLNPFRPHPFLPYPAKKAPFSCTLPPVQVSRDAGSAYPPSPGLFPSSLAALSCGPCLDGLLCLAVLAGEMEPCSASLAIPCGVTAQMHLCTHRLCLQPQCRTLLHPLQKQIEMQKQTTLQVTSALTANQDWLLYFCFFSIEEVGRKVQMPHSERGAISDL